MPAGADSSASLVIDTVAVTLSVPMATEASDTRDPVTTSSSTDVVWSSAAKAGPARIVALSSASFRT